ncbi:phospholipase-like protein [Tanacetum coccineum]
MSTLLELSAIAKSNNLKDMMILLFESENQKDLITADNMNMIAENLSIRVSEREMLIGELDNCPCTIAYDSAKLLREMNDSDLAKIRCLMASVSHIQIKDYEAKVIIRSKLKCFKIIEGKLDYNPRKIFRTTRWLDLAYFDHESHMIDYMLQKHCWVNDAHYDMPLTYYVNGRGLYFGCREFCLITGFRFGAVSFSSYSKGDMKFKERVFPHRVGLSITSLDLVGVIEDEEYFSQLCDEDAIRVCLLLCLEVIFMGKLMVKEVDDTLMRLVESLEAWNVFPWGEHIWMQLYDEIMNVVDNHKSEHLEGLHKSRKYVPTYTLGGFVWSFKVWILESFEMSNRWWNKLAEAIPRGIESHIFYIPRTTIRNPELFDAYLQKVSDSRKCNRLCRLISTPISNVPRSKISSVKDCIIKELNSRIFKLEAIIQKRRDCLKRRKGLDWKIKKGWLKLEQECELQVKKRWDEDYRKRKFDKKNECFGVVDRDMTEFLKTVKPWVEDLSRINSAIDYIWINEDLDLYLGKSGRLRCKFPWSVKVCVERPFWESLVCLDPTRQGWLLDEHIDKVMIQHKTQSEDDTEESVRQLRKGGTRIIGKGHTLMNSDHMKQAMARCAPKKRSGSVFIPINETGQHWFLAEFDIKSGVVTFYDSGGLYDLKLKDWYIGTRDCLKVSLTARSIRATEWGVFGDCGIWVCISLYRLANGLSLDVDDPVQIALAYRECLA